MVQRSPNCERRFIGTILALEIQSSLSPPKWNNANTRIADGYTVSDTISPAVNFVFNNRRTKSSK